MVKKIGLPTALLININIIIGAGVFLNVKPLALIAGSFGFAGYLLGATILFPFVLTLAKLAQAYPVSGGLYVYSKEYLGLFAGFVSGWSYFIGKTVSAAFLALAFTRFFQEQILFLQPYPTALLACLVIFTIILLNILGAHIGGSAQYVFILTKLIPIFFIYITGILTIQTGNFSSTPQPISSLAGTIPIALYAFMGFEITCSIGHMFKKSSSTIPRAIIGSFLFVTTIYIFFQLLATQQPFSLLSNKPIATLIFTSAIAGSFGILTSNCWNLHALALDNHFPGKKILTKISQTHVPWVGLLLEGGIACLMLLISDNQVALQSMSVFCVVTSFLLSTLAALLAVANKKLLINKWIPRLALAGCGYVLFLCLKNIQTAGVSLPFLALLFGGIGLKTLWLFNK
ncbi:amino acid permease [Candidatus Dependentiae bacterium]|nr:amino acid permease [Candidatus Dependentiae bacterium]